MAHKASDLMKNWQQAIELKRANPIPFRGTSVGLTAIDSVITKGIRIPSFTIVVARQKAGKTAFLLGLARSFLGNNLAVLFDSLEVGFFDIGTRLIAGSAQVDMDDVDGETIDMFSENKIEAAIASLEGEDYFVTYGKRTIQTLNAEIDDVKKRIGDKKLVVIVDYAQLMRDKRFLDNSYQMYTQIAEWMLASSIPESDDIDPETLLGLNCPGLVGMVTALQVPKADKKSKHVLTDSSARGTGAWEENAHYSFVIDSMVDDNGKPIPDLRKITMGGRFCRPGEAVVSFNGAQARFHDVPQAKTKLSLL